MQRIDPQPLEYVEWWNSGPAKLPSRTRIRLNSAQYGSWLAVQSLGLAICRAVKWLGE